MGHDTTAEPRAGGTTDEIGRAILRGLIARRVEVEGPDFDHADESLTSYARSVRAELERLPVRVDAPLPSRAVPFVPNTRVTFGPDRKPGTITAVVMRRAPGVEYEESGSVVAEPGPRMWEYDVLPDGDGRPVHGRRLVACQSSEVELLPVDLDEVAATLADCLDGDGRAATNIAGMLLAELTYRRATLDALTAFTAETLALLDRLRDGAGGGQ